MNKNLIVIGVLSLVILTLSLAGYVSAQGQPPPAGDYPYGTDMMGGYGVHGYGMMGYGYGMMGYGMMGSNGEEGPMHEAMIDALAENLDLSPEELETRHDAGESLWDIAKAEGLSYQEIRELMFSAHEAALEDAVADDRLTQEQADWMDGHMNQMWNGGYDHCEGAYGNRDGVRWHGMGR
jgi:hypothetical protein